MTFAANHQHRALLAIIAGGAAIVGLAVLTGGSLASTTHTRTDATSALGAFNWSLEYVEPAAFVMVPSPVIETHR